jgi:hypothetical protein
LSLKSSLQKWQRPPRNGLAHHQERVPRGTDAFSSRFQQFIGNVARIDPANCASACVDLSVILDASAIGFLKIECRSSTTNSSGVSSSLCRTSLDRTGGNVVHENTLNATKAGMNKERTFRKAVAVKRAIQESEKSVCVVPANEGPRP